jgi:hypothetical protein
MKKVLSILLTTGILLSGAIAQAKADDGAEGKSIEKKGWPRVAAIPKMAAGILVGTLVGTPIAAIRKSKSEDLEAMHYLAGDTEQKVVLVPAAAFWLPFAIITGVIESPVYGLMDSVKNYDKPFSKEQFSLGEKLP